MCEGDHSAHPPTPVPWLGKWTAGDKWRKEIGQSMQRCFPQYISPAEGGLRASWVGKFVFKSLKGLPSLEFVSSPFHQCCLQRKAKSDWVLERWSYSQAVPAIWTASSSAGWDQQVGVHTPSLGEVGLKTYLLVWPSWHLQWDSRVPTCCSAD